MQEKGEKKQMCDCKSIGIPSIAPAPIVHLSTLGRYSAHHNQSPPTTTIFHTLSLFGVVYIVKHHLCALRYAAPDEYAFFCLLSLAFEDLILTI